MYNRPLWAFQEFSLLFANIIFGPPLAWGRLCIGVLRNVTLWAWLQVLISHAHKALEASGPQSQSWKNYPPSSPKPLALDHKPSVTVLEGLSPLKP